MKHFSPATVRLLLAISIALLIAAPFVLYPQFLIEILCFALLAAALNLLVSYCGLLSFGHAMFFGAAGYVTAHAIKAWGFDPALGILAGVGHTSAGHLLFNDHARVFPIGLLHGLAHAIHRW
jgi:branched-chain amino acid transport system permease protein